MNKLQNLKNWKNRIWLLPLLPIVILLLIPLYPTDDLPGEVSSSSKSVFEFSTRYKFEYEKGRGTQIGGGTAFVIASDDEKTYLLTCAHCVNGDVLEDGIILNLGGKNSSTEPKYPTPPATPSEITIFFDYNNWTDADIVFLSDIYDVAILEITTGDYKFTPLSFTEPAWFGKVFALGYPQEANPLSTPLFYDEETELTITSGRITAFINLTPFERKYEEKPIGGIIVHSAHTNHGNSGGPLLNAKGEIVGINCCGINGSDETGYKYTGSVDSITLGKILKENGIEFQHNLSIRVIRDIVILVLVVMSLLLRPKKKINP